MLFLRPDCNVVPRTSGTQISLWARAAAGGTMKPRCRYEPGAAQYF